MSQLIQLKDFQFIALKDSVVITDEDRQKFLSQTTADFGTDVVDVPTSIAFIAKIKPCPYADDVFINGVENEKEIFEDVDYVYVFPKYSVKSDEIPLALKEAGIKITREQRIAYLAPGQTNDEPYILVNKDGTRFESEDKWAPG